MTIDKIIRLAYKQLQEDPAYPNFWDNHNGEGEISEMLNYGLEGLLDIIDQVDLHLTESSIPLYAQLEQEFDQDGNPILDPDTDEPVFSTRNFQGFYKPPIDRIQTIKNIYWKQRPTLEQNGDTYRWVDKPFIQLEPMTVDEMDRLDSDWRTKETFNTPTHAVIYSGNYNTMNMQNDKNRNGMKIKLYPTPTDIDEDYQTLISDLEGLESELDARRLSLYGGLMSDSGGNMVWGIDTDGDGDRDDSVLPGSTDLGILVNLMTGDIDLSRFGNYPIIQYIPAYDESFFTDLTNVDGEVVADWYELNNYIPRKLQDALKWYLCYRAFMKEGEAVDIKKSLMYKDLYDTYVSDYRASEYVTKKLQKTSDVNWSFGRNNNRNINKKYGPGYYGQGYRTW